jgi:spore germination protein KA
MPKMKKKGREAAGDAQPSGGDVQQMAVFESLEDNIKIMKELFKDVDMIRYKYIAKDGVNTYALVFSDGMVNCSMLSENLLGPLMAAEAPPKGPDLMRRLAFEMVEIAESELTDKFEKIISSVAYGETVLFADGCAEAALFGTRSIPTRAVSEPENEKTISGPREGFTESLLQNLSMLRRRARTNDFKIRQMTFGRRTKTSAAVCYFDGVVNRQALQEVFRRLEQIDIDGALDTNYLTELIRDNRLSPFRTIGYTERPDVAIARLLEGRISILLDGSPDVLTVPYLFVENFQSGEDYYLSFYYTSFSRMLRMLGFLMTISVPGLYVAVVAFQHEMLPTPLLLHITSERQGVPLPAALEAFAMLIVFDILRETGIRMPTNLGQALSIVGALVIGQAAVEAKLVAAPMIIVVATTGITSLLVPNLNAPIIYIRMFLLLLSSLFGFSGLAIGISLVVIHLITLESFGVPLVTFDGDLHLQAIKDTVVRAPWWDMVLRPKGISPNRTRMKPPEGP